MKNTTMDQHQELYLEETSMNVLQESTIYFKKYRGLAGEALLHELLKVNLDPKLKRPVDLLELPLIADYPPCEMIENDPDAYLQIIRRLQDAEHQLLHPDPPQEEEEARPTMGAVDQAIAAKDVKALYHTVQALVDLRARSAVEWACKKTEIKEVFGKAINMKDLESAMAAERRQREKALQDEQQDIANIARDWAYINREDWAYDIKERVWRHFNGAYWEEMPPKCDELDNEAIDALHNGGRDVNSLGSMETFIRTASAACARVFPVEQPGKINFLNQTLDTKTMTLYPHCREDYLTYCLPYDYAPGSHKHIDSMLEMIMPDPYARAAYMIHLGLALIGDTKMHNVLILLGPSRSGKSTLLALGNMTCGDEPFNAYNFADHYLFSRELEGKRARYQWGNRRLVSVDEVPSEALRDEELFKQMSAHGGVGMRGMMKDDKVNNRWRPKLILAANDQPRYRDVVGAVRERAIFIECPNHRPVGTRNLNLLDEAEPELGAFAAACIYMAKLTLEHNYYPLSSKMKVFLDDIDKEGSYLKSFLAEACIIDQAAEDQITTDDLYEGYISYCENNRVQRQYQLSKAIMSRQILSMRLGITPKRMLNQENVMVRGLVGIRLRSKSDHWETEDEKLRRFKSDEPLINGTLAVVNGEVTVLTGPDGSTSSSVNELEQPVEPEQQESLTDMTDKTENILPTKSSVIEPKQEIQTSKEEIETPIYPSYPSTAFIEQPVEPVQAIDRFVDAQQEHLSEPSAVLCDVKGCGKPAEPTSEEDAEKYGHWCSEHEDRLEMMALGEMLPDEPYKRLPYVERGCSAVAKGRTYWHHFAAHPDAPVKRVLEVINETLAGQSEETA